MSDTAPLPKIGRNELDALDEIARAQRSGLGRTQPFWWRRSSMRKLAMYGWVERDLRYGTEKSPAWVITNAGRAEWLKTREAA